MRRLRGYLVSCEAVAGILMQGKKLLSVRSKVPNDAVFLYSRFDDTKRCFVVVLEHESFDFVPECGSIPLENAYAECVELRPEFEVTWDADAEDDNNYIVTLGRPVGGPINLLIPKGDVDKEPYGLNMVCSGHYT